MSKGMMCTCRFGIPDDVVCVDHGAAELFDENLLEECSRCKAKREARAKGTGRPYAVGQTVRLNRHGLKQLRVEPFLQDEALRKTFKVTRFDAQNMVDLPVEVHNLEVDDRFLRPYLLTDQDFDLVDTA